MTNKKVLDWVSDMRELVKPDAVVWIDGSRSQLDELRQQALATGELIKLNQDKYPGCYLHRSAHNDVARSENKTFICTRDKADAGATNNWEAPEVMYAKLRALFGGAMRGRTMYVIPYCMGPYGSPFSKTGIEITDSIYVVLNMSIMARVGDKALDQMGEGDFVKGLHSKAQINEDERYICHFPEDNAIWSINSGYGGNALLGKKCFALRIASFQARREGWLAEHMVILGIENPKGEVQYVCAAFPSACGKTNLAMMIPPEIYKKKGYKIWCLGDDIAWLRIGKDGRLWAINPEAGFFGVVPGTNERTNPNALHAAMHDTIYTNVVYNQDDETVWWEGLNSAPPQNGVDWKGNPWNGKTAEAPGAHPNSRFTTPYENCPIKSPLANDPEGVPISAIIFGGRRAKTAPLVYEARDFNHGVFIGSILASETTAAATGAVGVVRRDPMAMLPFCGYNMGDYFGHWLEIGEKLGDKAPKVYNVNWFRIGPDGKFIWPGYGENIRVLEWILNRCNGLVGAIDTPVGYTPDPRDINLEDLPGITADTLAGLLHIDKDLWNDDAASIREFYDKLGEHLPQGMRRQLEELEMRLGQE